MARKRRTRQHVIADLSENLVERYALLAGYTIERMVHDYGIDLMLCTFDREGYVETGQVLIQVKASDNLRTAPNAGTVAVSVRRADLERWLNETMPVILMVYDAPGDVAYWSYLQAYFRERQEFALSAVGESVSE